MFSAEKKVTFMQYMEDKKFREEDIQSDFFKFLALRRGARGKMAVKNGDLFILWG